MGGSIGEGNKTVSAEFNIYADPGGGRHRLPVRHPDHDDGPRRHPSGAAATTPQRLDCVRRARPPARSPRSSSSSPWRASGPGTTPRRGHPRRRRRRPPRDRGPRRASRSTTSEVDVTHGPARGRTVARATRVASPCRAAAQRPGRHPPRPEAVRGRPRRRVRPACRSRARAPAGGRGPPPLRRPGRLVHDRDVRGRRRAMAEPARRATADPRARRQPRRQRVHLSRPDRGRAAATRRPPARVPHRS